MSDEAEKAGEGVEGKEEEGKKETVAAPAPAAAAAPTQEVDHARIAELERKAKIFDQIDSKYRQDEKYRQVFDKAWKGEFGEQEEGEEDPIEKLRAENAKTQKELDNLRASYGIDRITGERKSINVRYEDDFRRMASEVGYEPGSTAFDILYSDAVREGYILAKKYGLTTDSGDADPLRAYSPKFMEEAFKLAFEKHKRAGFDEAWKRKKEAEKEKKQVEYKDEVADYFKPEKLKTPSDRARALEQAFRKKFKGQNLKIV